MWYGNIDLKRYKMLVCIFVWSTSFHLKLPTNISIHIYLSIRHTNTNLVHEHVFNILFHKKEKFVHVKSILPDHEINIFEA